jgi:hypothetical protein
MDQVLDLVNIHGLLPKVEQGGKLSLQQTKFLLTTKKSQLAAIRIQ